jgi:hypothetical protein
VLSSRIVVNWRRVVGWRIKAVAHGGYDEGGCASGFILRLVSVDGGMRNDVSAK